jgi:hypothetical protein
MSERDVYAMTFVALREARARYTDMVRRYDAAREDALSRTAGLAEARLLYDVVVEKRQAHEALSLLEQQASVLGVEA